MSNDVQTYQPVQVEFQGDLIDAMWDERTDIVSVVCKRIAENLGMSWSTQLQKLQSRQFLRYINHVDINTVQGPREMICISLKGLTLWLANISIESVREDIQDKLIAYQAECADVLYAHFSSRDIAPSDVIDTTSLRAELREFKTDVIGEVRGMRDDLNSIFPRHDFSDTTKGRVVVFCWYNRSGKCCLCPNTLVTRGPFLSDKTDIARFHHMNGSSDSRIESCALICDSCHHELKNPEALERARQRFDVWHSERVQWEQDRNVQESLF